ncbi:14807_t:CDS:2 [Entrophospora sp. SA101]|nr:14807_t:CDS:2 [Entrophospora sp. SA101]
MIIILLQILDVLGMQVFVELVNSISSLIEAQLNDEINSTNQWTLLIKEVQLTNASDFAIGAVLSQDQGKGEQPVAYESRKLSPAELNYPVHEKELLAIVHAIKLWRPYLEGQRFTVITGHASLEYIKSQTNLSQRQARWLEVLQATDFDVKYHPGKTNIVADALS